MNNPRATHGPAGDEWNEAANLSILLACEDAVCGRYALGMMERVNDLLPLDTRAQTVIREFKAFQPLQHAFASEVWPDIVVMAAHGNQRLPEVVKDWLETWAKGSHGLTCALSAVLERHFWQSAESLEIITYLRNLAVVTGIDWLEVGSADLAAGQHFRQELKRQASQVSSTLDEIIRAPHPPAQP